MEKIKVSNELEKLIQQDNVIIMYVSKDGVDEYVIADQRDVDYAQKVLTAYTN